MHLSFLDTYHQVLIWTLTLYCILLVHTVCAKISDRESEKFTSVKLLSNKTDNNKGYRLDNDINGRLLMVNPNTLGKINGTDEKIGGNTSSFTVVFSISNFNIISSMSFVV